MKIARQLGQKGSFLRSVGALLAGRVSAQGLTLLLMPVVTRLYSPQEIGTASIVIVFAGIASTVGALKLDIAIVSEKYERNALTLFKLCLWLVLPVSVFAIVIAWLFKRYALFGYEAMPASSLLLLFFLLVFIALQNILRLYLVRTEKYWPISIQGLSYSVSRMSLMLLGGYFWAHWMVYLAADLVGRVCSALSVVKSIPWREIIDVPLTKKRVWMLVRKHRKMPMFSVPSTLLDITAVSLPVPLIARGFGVEAAGLFVLVHRVVLGTSSLLGIVIADVFHGRVAKRSHTGGHQGYQFFMKTTGLLAVVAVFPAAVLYIFGPDLFALVFGEQWRLSGELARVVAPWAFFQLIVSPTSRVIYVYDWQGTKLFYDVVVLAATLFVFYYGSFRSWELNQTVTSLSVLNCLAYVFFFFLMFAKIRKLKCRRA